MAISREKKEQLVQEYVESFSGSEAVIITSYRGLKVSELETLRAKIREAEGSFSVVKNTLAQRAFEQVGLPLKDDYLTGPMAIGFCGSNIPAVAKAITDFSDDNELLIIKGGYLGTEVVDEAAIKNLASLPPLEVLQAQLLGLINTPATQLAGVLASSVRQVVNVVHAYSEKEAEEAPSAEG